MCKAAAIDNTARCIKHQDKSHSKFLKILSAIKNSKEFTGFNLSKSAFRAFNRPDESLNQEVYEYAPCLEGALPAFKDSLANLEKVLLAGYDSYCDSMLADGIAFNDKYYRARFPNDKDISSHQWMHTYLATREHLKSLRLVGVYKTQFFDTSI